MRSTDWERDVAALWDDVDIDDRLSWFTRATRHTPELIYLG
ncbi:hypothetical protein [Demequina silvatica]|nr:hypothetical protein [Demequina silvatica]